MEASPRANTAGASAELGRLVVGTNRDNVYAQSQPVPRLTDARPDMLPSRLVQRVMPQASVRHHLQWNDVANSDGFRKVSLN